MKAVKENKENAKSRAVYTKFQCLDIVEAAHREKAYPLIFCHLHFQGHIDTSRLKKSVECTSLYIPEILYACDFLNGRFIDKGFKAEDVIIENDRYPGSWKWDLENETQLKILLYSENREVKVVIGMSHILSDGAGFLQYLYLLSHFYNGTQPTQVLQNTRNPAYVLKGIKVQPATEQVKESHKTFMRPLELYGDGTLPFCLCEEIPPGVMCHLRAKARKCHVTLNDVFLTAYARVIGKIQGTDIVTIPCPADLRRFAHKANVLTVANMTGMYREVPVEVKEQFTFTDIVGQVHLEMLLQKSRKRCFTGITALYAMSESIPFRILNRICRAGYFLHPISYTNIGGIDEAKLFFDGCSIKKCFITGTYRSAPYFQLSVSTYRDTCTLNSSMIGDARQMDLCREILQAVKYELIKWTDE